MRWGLFRGESCSLPGPGLDGKEVWDWLGWGLVGVKPPHPLLPLKKSILLLPSRYHNPGFFALNSEHQAVSTRTENILLHSKTQQWWRNERGKRQLEEKRPVYKIHFTPTDILKKNNKVVVIVMKVEVAVLATMYWTLNYMMGNFMYLRSVNSHMIKCISWGSECLRNTGRWTHLKFAFTIRTWLLRAWHWWMVNHNSSKTFSMGAEDAGPL